MKKYLLFIFLILFGSITKAQPGANDPTFNPGDQGFDYGAGADNRINTIAIQNDGKIIIAGQLNSYNGALNNRIARLNDDGSVDAAFYSGSGANYEIFATAVQNDGKIIIAGNFTSYNGTAIKRVARLNTNGTIDASFNIGTGISHCVYATAIQSDGKIIVAGDFDTINGTPSYRSARLNTDGSLDTTFS